MTIDDGCREDDEILLFSDAVVVPGVYSTIPYPACHFFVVVVHIIHISSGRGKDESSHKFAVKYHGYIPPQG